MIKNQFDGVVVRAIVSDVPTNSENVWFAGWDVSKLLGKRIQKSHLVRTGMIEGVDFVYVMVTDDLYFDLLSPTERKIMRAKRKQAEKLVPHLGTGSAEAEKLGRKSRPRVPGAWQFNGQQKRLLISEACFYHLVFTARSPFAKAMRRWLADEVIPSIRRHGKYQIPDDHSIWEVFEEMEAELGFYGAVFKNAEEKITVADILNTAAGRPLNAQHMLKEVA
jgi:prophage antirepressor-like protein